MPIALALEGNTLAPRFRGGSRMEGLSPKGAFAADEFQAVDPGWIPTRPEEADLIVERWTRRKIEALRRERGLDDEVETTRRFVQRTIPEYADRFLLELVQNAHDALPAGGGGRVRVELDLDAETGPALIVANTGTPFRFRDFRALVRMAQSEKPPGEGIGYKGVGFKSVLQVAPRPEIYSASADPALDPYSGFRFTFPDADEYEVMIAGVPPTAPRMTPYSLPVRIAMGDQPSIVRTMAASGFATTIRLPIREDARATAVEAVHALVAVDAPVLLFLERIDELVVVIRDGSTIDEQRLLRSSTQLAARDSDRIDLVDVSGHRYLIAHGEVSEQDFLDAIAADVPAGLADETWSEWKGSASVSVALPVDREPVDDRLYCYLPMLRSSQSPVAGHVNAPFATDIARKELVPGSRMNDLLMNAAADVSVRAAQVLQTTGHHRAQVVDLIAWPREGRRLVGAWGRSGALIENAEIVPVLGGDGWSSFREARSWNPPEVQRLTPGAVVSLRGVPLVDPAIGERRMAALSAFAEGMLEVRLAPEPEQLADWAEAVALDIHRSDRRAGPPSAAWLQFYDDLPHVFNDAAARSLGGKRIIIGEEKELLPAWADGGKRRPRSRHRGVFFARSAGDDAADDGSDDVAVPPSLRRTFGRVHPDLDWHVPGDTVRRNRPGRLFLENQALVRVPRISDLLRLVEQILAQSKSKSVWRDALVYIHRLTRPTPRRPDLASLGLSRLGLRVPTVAGWQPGDRARFARGWTPIGEQLSQLVEASGDASAEIAELGGRLLESPSAWIPKGTTVESWVEFLGHCGVRDGLPVVAIGSPSGRPQQLGWWWRTPELLAAHLRIEGELADSWLKSLDFGGWPNHSGAEYVMTGQPCRIPGQTDFNRLPLSARRLYALLLAEGLARWTDDLLGFEVHRRANGSDPYVIPSPARVFLEETAWVPVNRPGGGGEEDWAVPRDAWIVDQSEREPYYAPVVAPRLRSVLLNSNRGSQRFLALGAHAWSAPEHAPAKLVLLGGLLHDRRVLPGFIAQARNAADDAWQALIDGGGSLRIPDDAHLIVVRGESTGTVAVASGERFYVLKTADRLVELVLSSLSEPVLVAPGALGVHVHAELQVAGIKQAQLIGPGDLDVEVDGRPVSELIPGAELLIGGERAWLAELVALTLELKQSDFRVTTAKIVSDAVQRLLEIRVVAGTDIALRLDGVRREVPEYSRRVVPTSVAGAAAIAWTPTEDPLGWRDARRLAPAIVELIRERWARDALENVLGLLAEGGVPFSDLDDQALAEAFGVAQGRMSEQRRAYRQEGGQVLVRLVAVVAAQLGGSAARLFRSRVLEDEDPDRAMERELEALRDSLGPLSAFDALLEAAHSARSTYEIRDILSLDFGQFNRALVELGPPYRPETYPETHADAMWSFVAGHRDEIVDSLRARAIALGLDGPDALDDYGAAVSELDMAVARPARQIGGSLLAADPAWLIDYRDPPEESLVVRVNAWLRQKDAPAMGTGTGRENPSALRAENGAALARFTSRAAPIVATWTELHGVAAPTWILTAADLAGTVAASGRLDFNGLTEGRALELVAEIGGWPAGMALSLALPILGLTEGDLERQRRGETERKASVDREKRGVEVAGRLLTLDSDAADETVAFFVGTIDARVLSTPTRDAALTDPPGRRGGGSSGGSGGQGRGRPSKEKLETIGVFGEIVTFKWLQHHFGEANVRWRSTNRTYVIHDGDPGDDALGYDFEVIRGRGPVYWEAKASTRDPREFELTEAEVAFALSRSRFGNYRVLYIGNVGVPDDRVIFPLPNPLSARAREQFRRSEAGIKYGFKVEG